jgi:Na+-driven multidrug efflux pump
MFNGLFQVLGQSFIALKKPQSFAFCQLGGTVLCVPVMIYAVRTHGLTGVASVFALAGLVRIFLLMVCYPLVLKLPMPRLLLQRDDLFWVRSMVVKI